MISWFLILQCPLQIFNPRQSQQYELLSFMKQVRFLFFVVPRSRFSVAPSDSKLRRLLYSAALLGTFNSPPVSHSESQSIMKFDGIELSNLDIKIKFSLQNSKIFIIEFKIFIIESKNFQLGIELRELQIISVLIERTITISSKIAVMLTKQSVCGRGERTIPSLPGILEEKTIKRRGSKCVVKLTSKRENN